MSQTDPASLASIDRESRWPMRAVIAVAVLVTFGVSLGHQFVGWDDQDLITGNRNINPPTLAGLENHWTGPDHQMYIPVVYTAWWTLAHVPGTPVPNHASQLNPAAFHAANLIVHLLAALVVFEILFELVGKTWAACAGAMVFALHPLQTEPVAWATGMKDVLSGALALAAIWQYIAARRDDSARRYLFATAIFVLALFAKPSTICVPIICALIDWLVLRGSWQRIAMWLGPWLIPAAIIAYVGAKVQPVPTELVVPIWQRPLIAADALAWYLTKLVLPFGLAIDYSRTPVNVLRSGWAQYSILALIIVATVITQARRRVYVAAGLVFVAALLPVLGLAAFAFQRYSTVADRYVYLAMLGPALALAAFLSMRPMEKWRALAGIVGVATMVLSIRQTLFWRDTLSLFTHTIEVNPTSLAGTRSLGFYWAEHGDDAKAVAYYELANRAHPEDPSNHFNYANLLRRRGLLDGALEHYQQAVAREPQNTSFLINFGVTLAMAGRNEPALAAFQKIVDIDPNNTDAYQNAGLVLERLGAVEQARLAFMEALRCDPSRTVPRQHLARLAAPSTSRAP